MAEFRDAAGAGRAARAAVALAETPSTASVLLFRTYSVLLLSVYVMYPSHS